MRMQDATWIAHGSPPSTAERPIADSPLPSVVLSSTQIAAIWQRMQRARQEWMRLPMSQRVRQLAGLSQDLCLEGPAQDGDILAHSTGLSREGMRAAWDVTFSPWTEDSINELMRSEALPLEALAVHDVDRIGPVLPRRLVHILAGNVLPPTWSLLMRGWILGAVQWLRPSAREPLFAGCVLRRVATHEPLLAAMTTVTWWPHGQSDLEPMASEILRGADVVTAHGEDASIAAIEASLQELVPSPQFVGYGGRWSCVVLGKQDLTQETATSVARDVALFDQQGCLSPTRILVPADGRPHEWCRSLAQALALQQRHMPRGEPGERGRAALRHWLERMRLAQVEGKVQEMWTPATGTAWSVVLTKACGDWQSPLDRHIVVLPVTGVAELQRSLGSLLQTVQGVAVRSAVCDDPWCQAILQALRPTRIAVAGTLQQATPDWRQDHRRPLRSLLVGSINDS